LIFCQFFWTRGKYQESGNFMTDFNDTLKQAADLVDQYLELQKQKEDLDQKLSFLKQRIAAFSQESHMKTLKSGDSLLFVNRRMRTVFPKVHEDGREEIEEILRHSGEWKYAITFDIVKLGQAYDKKKLSEELREKLKPFTRQEEMVRVALKNVNHGG